MNFPYKHVLLIGATSGIGLAMANKMLKHNIEVTAMGRRQDRLDAWVQENGDDKAHAVAFDIGQIDAIPQMVTRRYPNIDCVFINAGFQRATDFTSADSVDLSIYNQIMHINYTAAVSLATAFLPFLSGKENATSIIFTQSNLAIVPAPSLLGYCASKAALNTFAMCLRCQLTDAHSQVKVIELFPPAVQTELHDYIGPERGRQMGMPLDEFTDQAWAGLSSGDDEVFVGFIPPKERFFSIARERRAACEDLSQQIKELHKKDV
ncbi:oxidoreductase, short-chain dehydrogenase/reductase family [Aspergillus saccharolyticus JOP 1030-1]|uniref:NAD(P)-binding protein n=1 Tax=Aspergillus saccharolyticus JOP 1030-1 TaxID=1450539 RepID=A0A318Z6Z6_9EURO|nr:NAD(P)-binding protein [Aspergillus saccharolyticus JOP 1030-1]PYH43105.1 NAD(P)-binding protein [Aspergillus saccharolyticus JOP 1030-1]